MANLGAIGRNKPVGTLAHVAQGVHQGTTVGVMSRPESECATPPAASASGGGGGISVF